MELDLNEADVQSMTTLLRKGVVEKYEPPKLSGTVEFDEVYIVAGHKGQPIKLLKAARFQMPPVKGRSGQRDFG